MLSANRPPVFGTEHRHSAFPRTVGGTDGEGQKNTVASLSPAPCVPTQRAPRTCLHVAPVFCLPLGGKVQIGGTCATRGCVGGEISWRGDGIGGAKQA